MTNFIIKSITDLFFMLLFLILCLGLGKRIWSCLFDSARTAVDMFEEGIFCICIGLGILSFIILILGLAGILRFWIVLAIFVLLLIMVFKEIKGYCLTCLKIRKSHFLQIFRSPYFLILSPFFMISLIWLFLTTRIPPLFYDALVYHLGVPNQYLIHHSIRFMPFSFHSHHPFLIQNLFSITLLLGGYGSTKLLIMTFVVLNVMSLSLLTVRLSGRPISWLAGGIFLLTPTMLVVGSLVTVDLGFSLYTLLAFYALCIWVIKKEQRWLIVSALMTGFSLGIKYTAIIYCFGLCLLCLVFALIKERENIRYAAKVCILYILIAAAIGSGWYIKNMVWTRNPFYPKWADVWGNPKIPKKNLDAFHASAHAFDFKNFKVGRILSMPSELLFHPENFGVGGSIGILFLILFPLAFFPDKKNQVYSILILFCIAYLVAWIFTFRMTRFALPLIAIIILLATNTLARLIQSQQKFFRYLIMIILMLGFAYNLHYSIGIFSRVYQPWEYLRCKESEDSYLSRAIPSYPIFRYINNTLPAQSRILFLGETINFYCYRDVIASSAFDINPLIPILKNKKTSEDIRTALRGMKVTHLLINFKEMDRLECYYQTFGLNEKDLQQLLDFLRSSSILLRHRDIFLVKV